MAESMTIGSQIAPLTTNVGIFIGVNDEIHMQNMGNQKNEIPNETTCLDTMSSFVLFGHTDLKPAS